MKTCGKMFVLHIKMLALISIMIMLVLMRISHSHTGRHLMKAPDK